MAPTDPFDDRLLEAVQLPAGVSARQWAEEKSTWQNPRIRALLGCSGLLESALESNQAILSCSPERLAEIWAAVRGVARVISEELIPLFEGASVVPRLEEARRRARNAAGMLASTVVEEIAQMPEQIDDERSKEFRKLICISLGQLDDFLQDSFGDLMSNDPRSFHDSGYFLSRRFRRDVEEAEWLITTVDGLSAQLAGFEARRQSDLGGLLPRLREGETLPEDEALRPTTELLRDLTRELTPRLKEAAALRGIRFAELEIVDRWAVDLPTHCAVALELMSLAEQSRRPDESGSQLWKRTVATRVRELLAGVDELLKDLRAFLPLWRRGIGNRRALVFRRAESGIV